MPPAEFSMDMAFMETEVIQDLQAPLEVMREIEAFTEEKCA